MLRAHSALKMETTMCSTRDWHAFNVTDAVSFYHTMDKQHQLIFMGNIFTKFSLQRYNKGQAGILQSHTQISTEFDALHKIMLV